MRSENPYAAHGGQNPAPQHDLAPSSGASLFQRHCYSGHLSHMGCALFSNGQITCLSPRS